ncbi:hypothetical protein KQX54_000166 [Cotesia glomerata]|uniref:Uncharacterized protein n=1 Tax=Cotesia glomerata TaxID=32391 RepID=A0AAV7ISK4_COTGL|nr:hypothetical protein KQX54_000166 [Cotesia glomerata]
MLFLVSSDKVTMQCTSLDEIGFFWIKSSAIITEFTCGRTEITRAFEYQATFKLFAPENSGYFLLLLMLCFQETFLPPAFSQSESSSSSSSVELEFNERVKAAEIRFATLLAQNNIPMTNAPIILKLFHLELLKKEIPQSQIVGLACDNASVMVGNKNSFKILIEETNPLLFTIPCICHSLALLAKDACAAIPDDIHNFIANICSFINNSPKRLGLFEEIPELLSNFKNWDAIHGLLIDQAAAKVSTADQLLAIMNNPSTKAYLLFLQSELELFNKINAHFQGNKTLVQELQPSSYKFLVTILKKFMKPSLLTEANLSKDFHNIDFKNDMNLRPCLK